MRHCSGCFARSRLCADPPALRPGRSGWAGMAGAPCCGGAGAMGGRGPDDSAEARHRAQVLAHAGRPWLWIAYEPFASACSHAFHFVHTGADGSDIIWLCVVGRPRRPGLTFFCQQEAYEFVTTANLQACLDSLPRPIPTSAHSHIGACPARALLGQMRQMHRLLHLCTRVSTVPPLLAGPTVHSVLMSAAKRASAVSARRIVLGIRASHATWYPIRHVRHIGIRIRSGVRSIIFIAGEIDCREGVDAAIDKGKYTRCSTGPPTARWCKQNHRPTACALPPKTVRFGATVCTD